MNVDYKRRNMYNIIRDMNRIKKRQNHCQLKLWGRVKNVDTL